MQRPVWYLPHAMTQSVCRCMCLPCVHTTSHSGAKVLWTTQWKTQLIPPCHCLVSPQSAECSGFAVGRHRAMCWVQGGFPGCWGPLCWRGVLEGCRQWPLLSTGRIPEVTLFEGAMWSLTFPHCNDNSIGEFTPVSAIPFPRRAACTLCLCCLQFCFSVILSLAFIPANYGFPYILYLSAIQGNKNE